MAADFIIKCNVKSLANTPVMSIMIYVGQVIWVF